MEEILASIKRVIAEDGRAAMARPSRATARAEPEPSLSEVDAPEEDVLELDDPVSDLDGLVSPGAAAASRQSLAALAALRDPDEPGEQLAVGPLEAVVRDMLRPMLKDWLDQRLPDMVEQLVTREIARITGRSF